MSIDLAATKYAIRCKYGSLRACAIKYNVTSQDFYCAVNDVLGKPWLEVRKTQRAAILKRLRREGLVKEQATNGGNDAA